MSNEEQSDSASPVSLKKLLNEDIKKISTTASNDEKQATDRDAVRAVHKRDRKERVGTPQTTRSRVRRSHTTRGAHNALPRGATTGRSHRVPKIHYDSVRYKDKRRINGYSRGDKSVRRKSHRGEEPANRGDHMQYGIWPKYEDSTKNESTLSPPRDPKVTRELRGSEDTAARDVVQKMGTFFKQFHGMIGELLDENRRLKSGAKGGAASGGSLSYSSLPSIGDVGKYKEKIEELRREKGALKKHNLQLLKENEALKKEVNNLTAIITITLMKTENELLNNKSKFIEPPQPYDDVDMTPEPPADTGKTDPLFDDNLSTGSFGEDVKDGVKM